MIAYGIATIGELALADGRAEEAGRLLGRAEALFAEPESSGTARRPRATSGRSRRSPASSATSGSGAAGEGAR